VDDAAQLRKFAVKQGMGVEIAGGAQMAFDDFAVEIGDDQIGGNEGCVIDAAGFDDDKRLSPGSVNTLTTYAAGIAEGVWGEAAPGDFLIGFENLLTE
jgi:hypothetical protein